MNATSVMQGPWQALTPDRLELGEGARIFSGRLHYVDLLQGRVFAPHARPGAASEGLADLARPAAAGGPATGRPTAPPGQRGGGAGAGGGGGVRGAAPPAAGPRCRGFTTRR